VSYKPQIFHLLQRIRTDQHYTLVLSSFTREMGLGGSLTFESTLPLTVRTIPGEGEGMIAQTINGCWKKSTAGGC
jgi:hypothetical protein